MKKLIVALMVLSTLASCGKDNKVASPAAATTTATSPATTTVSTTDQLGVALGQKIDAHTSQFGFAQYNYYYSMQAVINAGGSVYFYFTQDAQTAETTGCEVKWKIFTVCTGGDSSSLTTSRTVDSKAVTVATKISELKNLINTRHAAYPIQVSGYSYWIKTSDNKEYIIDTRLPIQANPVSIKDPSTGKTEYLFKYN